MTLYALGNKYINTPNLDRLVQNGVAFTNAYTQCPICTPSRTTFLTGKYPATHQVQRNGNDYFPPSEVLVTKLMADAGYDCGLIGKLHLSRCDGRTEIRPRMMVVGFTNGVITQTPIIRRVMIMPIGWKRKKA